MSVLVPPLANSHHHHHHHHHPPHHHRTHASYFPPNPNRRISANPSQTSTQNRVPTNSLNENEPTTDHVPFGVVNSMKQRFLDKVNESLVVNNNSALVRSSLLKSSSRISSNENLLQPKTAVSSLKHATRLSRSQDNLTNNTTIIPTATSTINPTSTQIVANEQFTSYIQPKQDVIIVDATVNHQHHHYHENNHDDDGKLRTSQKTLAHRQSYTELHVDEAPKPGTVTTVKNMFERQIRLSRYDADKLNIVSTSGGSRVSSQHRETGSPPRSRSISPNDMALRQRRTVVAGSTTLPISSTTLSLPASTTYPDLVISHTPPTEPTKPSTEQIQNENLLINNQSVSKDKKISTAIRNTVANEHIPLSVIVDECLANTSSNSRPNLLLPSKILSENVECEPLDFKSRLALFNRTNTNQRSNETPPFVKKSLLSHVNSTPANILTKPVVHQPPRVIPEEQKDVPIENANNNLPIQISRSVVNTAKAVTFFGGNKLNDNTKSSLPESIQPIVSPPSPPEVTNKPEVSIPVDPLRPPDVIGGNIKLTKSSMFSGAKKHIRVQFLEDVDTFEYPSFEVFMAEHGNDGSDDENVMEVDENVSNRTNQSDTITNKTQQNYTNKNNIYGNESSTDDQSVNNHNQNNQADDVDDDELDRLARINAEFNTNNLSDNTLKPKGSLHTFRPTHLDQYELGTQHGSQPTAKLSDISSPANSYSILARQKLLLTSDISTKNLSNHAILKPTKSSFDMTNNIQWSSMSTTTDLLF